MVEWRTEKVDLFRGDYSRRVEFWCRPEGFYPGSDAEWKAMREQVILAERSAANAEGRPVRGWAIESPDG